MSRALPRLGSLPCLVAVPWLVSITVLAGCAGAAQEDTSGLRVVRRTPDEFCRGTARSLAVDRYVLKRDGVPLSKALAQNGGVDVIDAVTRAVYGGEVRSEAQAADAGTAACLRYFR
jgi:hypothetical protein